MRGSAPWGECVCVPWSTVWPWARRLAGQCPPRLLLGGDGLLAVGSARPPRLSAGDRPLLSAPVRWQLGATRSELTRACPVLVSFMS